ncbi:WW domain binding protein VOPP1 isoform X2 [Lagenorhynchus albirostris]|uniref:WW domain binding protein VOPP1 isoform X2 n=1 Tax=Lagenorhynchus albirostris TaxID=27610 RepID=UPI0028E7A403|nr:WW domain binding protein VOPP1 isoform X2 [Lagenorhynchus albirostris]
MCPEPRLGGAAEQGSASRAEVPASSKPEKGASGNRRTGRGKTPPEVGVPSSVSLPPALGGCRCRAGARENPDCFRRVTQRNRRQARVSGSTLAWCQREPRVAQRPKSIAGILKDSIQPITYAAPTRTAVAPGAVCGPSPSRGSGIFDSAQMSL